jgi:hypothetical protein
LSETWRRQFELFRAISGGNNEDIIGIALALSGATALVSHLSRDPAKAFDQQTSAKAFDQF